VKPDIEVPRYEEVLAGYRASTRKELLAQPDVLTAAGVLTGQGHAFTAR
jgi:hypothetical protein